jgi:prophage regulatory protein
MAYKILRLPNVMDRVGFARSSIYAFVSKGSFPPPIKIGSRAVGWLDAEIDSWIQARVEETKRSEGGAK